MYTLHVYEDLVQVTALVLNRTRHLDTQMRPEDFALQLDSGPVFHPRHMRLEGDDPVSIAILLDESWPGAAELTRMLAESLVRLPPGALSAEDHISIYAFDCNMLVVARDLNGLSPTLPSSITQALGQPALHASLKGNERRCSRQVGLWDAMNAVGLQQQHAPGRRVMLVLSPGETALSRNNPESVRLGLAAEGISVFGAVPANTASLTTALQQERLFDLLCGGTGGVTTLVTGHTLADWFADALKMVRGRYVLEFNRPRNESAGLHQIDVTTRKKDDRVFVGGTLIPLRDARLAVDPYTVPNGAAEAPVIGSRRILKPE